MQPSILLTTLNAKYIHLNLAIRILYDLNHHRGNIYWKEFTIKSDFDDVAENKWDVVKESAASFFSKVGEAWKEDFERVKQAFKKEVDTASDLAQDTETEAKEVQQA